MDPRLSASQQALNQQARELAQQVIAPRAAEVDRSEQYPWDNVTALRDAGFFGMTIPKQYGGKAASYLDAVLVIDEMAQVCGVSGGGVARLHLIFARVFDEQGKEEGIGGFIAVRDETPGLVIGKRAPTMG